MPLFKKRAKLPPIKLLDPIQTTATTEVKDEITEAIEKILKRSKYVTKLEIINNAPRYYQYRFKLFNGSKVSNTSKLARAIAQELDIDGVRVEMEAKQNGRLIIEVLKPKCDMVTLREALESPEFKNAEGKLLFPVGKQADGTFIVKDLHKLPHIMSGGMTNSGMNAFMEQTFLLSLLLHNTPDQLRLLIIDPKHIQFPQYNGIPHLLKPAITDYEDALDALKSMIGELENRFETLSQHSMRDIDEYNQHATDKMPHIVVIVGEMADLMMINSRDFEAVFVRLLQTGRAVGIHIFIASQRPSIDVFTGLLKANFPARLAFATASKYDSRRLLDTFGAEILQGRGDLLYSDSDLYPPVRLQAPYTTTEEAQRVIKFLKNK